MQSINMVTINTDHKVDLDLVRVVEQAKGYFPGEVWDEIRYLGDLTLERDFNISLGRKTLGAFLFEKLIAKIRKVMNELGLESLLLGITPDPIVSTSYFFDKQTFKRIVYLVHDYVNVKLGVVSLFSVDEKTSSKVVAHGLGHSKGLHHHEKPVDLMHPALLRLPSLQVNGFCKTCLRDLKENRDFL